MVCDLIILGAGIFLSAGIILINIIIRQETIMAAIDDLGGAVSALQATATATLAKINDLKNVPNNDAAILDATTKINDVVGQLNTAIQ